MTGAISYVEDSPGVVPGPFLINEGVMAQAVVGIGTNNYLIFVVTPCEPRNLAVGCVAIQDQFHEP